MNKRCTQWIDETLQALSESVKHTKLPSALAYDEMNNEIEQWNDEMNKEMTKWTIKVWNPTRVK